MDYDRFTSTLNLQYASSLYAQPAGLNAAAAKELWRNRGGSAARQGSRGRRGVVAAQCNAWFGLKEA